MWQGEGWALREVALLQLVLAGLFASVGLGSESPERDCCDSLYPFIPAPEVTQSVPYWTDYPLETTKKYQPPVIDVSKDITRKPAWGPPEEPDIWIVNPRPQTTAKTKTKATTTIRSITGMKYRSRKETCHRKVSTRKCMKGNKRIWRHGNNNDFILITIPLYMPSYVMAIWYGCFHIT